MIQLQRQRANIPAKYHGAKLQALLVKLLEGFYEFNGDVPFNKQKTRFQQWAQAKQALQAEAHNKCAYCESNTAVVAYSDVEHFRPKDLYWWLAFSFDNYTYSCQLCNQKFKSANFPVQGKRVTPPKLPRAKPAGAKLATLAAQLCPDPATDHDTALRSYFKVEAAHLPHPYLDDPEALFAWQVDDINCEITLVSNGAASKARRAVKAAEDYLGLNREDLRRARYAQYRLVHALCLALQEVTKPAAHKQVVEALRRTAASDQSYAAMTRYFLRKLGVLA